MTTSATDTLADIQAMLKSGHASVRIERHSFFIFGLGAGLMILLMDWGIRYAALGSVWMEVVMGTGLMAIGIPILVWLDHMLTARARKDSGETVSFVQAQLSKYLWLTGAFIIAMYLALGFIEVTVLIYPIAISALGFYFLVAGQFSRQALGWAGLTFIAAAILLPVTVPESVQKWMWHGIIAFGVGLPLLGILSDIAPLQASRLRQFLTSLVWLGLIVGGTSFVFDQLKGIKTPDLPHITLQDYLGNPKKYDGSSVVVSLPKGTKVPVSFKISGKIISEPAVTSVMMMTTKAPILVVMQKGKPDGRLKVGQRPWQNGRTHEPAVWSTNSKTTLDGDNGPTAAFNLTLRF